ncbi:DUF4386 domain-containing protein [Amphibacillus cookii]|uniref:DUF4386 domain-containing protein n=1 Tax=Amphibacillus cookii TaxID=767787 RepID=UPI00195E6EAD|nr:DUF4386 domain-containing protein [Amphibacillus cookii]MBM7542115.1 hypothetical protein [Amphibacillus cookii]
MNANQKVARSVGVLYIIGTIAGILSVVFTGWTTGSDVAYVSASENEVKVGILFILIMAFSLAMVPVVTYPIFRKYHETLATGYVIFRGALETFTYIITAIWLWLVLLSNMSTDVSSSDTFQHIDYLLSGAGELIHSITMVVFSLGALMLYYLLYQFKLLPRWLSSWGLLASMLYLLTGIFDFFGSVSTLLLMPLALQEMVMAVWLIIKGFNRELKEI